MKISYASRMRDSLYSGRIAHWAKLASALRPRGEVLALGVCSSLPFLADSYGGEMDCPRMRRAGDWDAWRGGLAYDCCFDRS